MRWFALVLLMALTAPARPQVVTLTGTITDARPTKQFGCYEIKIGGSQVSGALIFDNRGYGMPNVGQGAVMLEVVTSSGAIYSDVYIGDAVYQGQV